MADENQGGEVTIESLQARLAALADPHWETSGYASEDAEIEDMATIGRGLIEAIADNSKAGPLQGWMPANSPVEVVVDLLNMIGDRAGELTDLRASLAATKGHATRAKNEAAVLRAELSPTPRRVGRPVAAFGKPGEAYSPELAALAIADDEDVEIVFSDGKREINAIAPLRVRRDGWLMTGGRHMLREPVEIEGGEDDLEIAGFAMLSGGEQVGWRELPDPVRVPKNGRVRLENCITF